MWPHMWPGLQRPDSKFLEINIFASVNSMYVKVCSVEHQCCTANDTRLHRKGSNTLTLYGSLWRLILHKFNYTIITYGYFNIWSGDKDHSTQSEMIIPIIYILNTKTNYRNKLLRGLKCLINKYHFWLFANIYSRRKHNMETTQKIFTPDMVRSGT